MIDKYYVIIYESKGEYFVVSGNKRRGDIHGTHKRTLSFNIACETIDAFRDRVKREVEEFKNTHSVQVISGWDNVEVVLNAL